MLQESFIPSVGTAETNAAKIAAAAKISSLENIEEWDFPVSSSEGCADCYAAKSSCFYTA